MFIFRYVFIFIIAFALTGCAKKVEGPYDASKQATMIVQFLADKNLPSLTKAQRTELILRVIDILYEQHKVDVAFKVSDVDPLSKTFDEYLKPVGTFAVDFRYKMVTPVTVDTKRSVLTSINRAKQRRKLSGLNEAVGLHPNVVAPDLVTANFLEAFTYYNDKLLEAPYPTGGKLIRPEFADRRSIYNWYLLINTWDIDKKPADVIITNDLLIFDSLASLPAHAVPSASVVTGYSRIFPGVSVVSTLPFLSKTEPFKTWQGGITDVERIELIARSVAHEIGTRLFLMENDEYDPKQCGRRPVWPPYDKWLKVANSERSCNLVAAHEDRARLATAYYVNFFDHSMRKGDIESSEKALKQLKTLAPKEAFVKQRAENLAKTKASRRTK